MSGERWKQSIVGGRDRSQAVCVIGFFSTINLVTEISAFEISIIQCQYYFSCIMSTAVSIRDTKMEIRI